MLEALAVLLFILWMIGLLSSYTLGGFVHVLLIGSAIVLLVGFIGDRRRYNY